jgi:hypothetical protein
MLKVTAVECETALKFELPQATSLPITIDSETIERRKAARQLSEDDRVAEARFSNRDTELNGKVVTVSGGSHEIRQALVILLSTEGADVAMVYREGEEESAQMLVDQVEMSGKRVLAIGGDIADSAFCDKASALVAVEFGKIDMMITSLQ